MVREPTALSAIDAAAAELAVTPCSADTCNALVGRRPCGEIRAELRHLLSALPGVLSEQRAVCDILAVEPMTRELRSEAEHLAGEVFLGRRVLLSGLDALSGRCPATPSDALTALAEHLRVCVADVVAAVGGRVEPALCDPPPRS